MTNHPPNLCPHCGRPIQDNRELAHDVRLAHHVPSCSTWNNTSQTTPEYEDREYDHRGVAMPRRTRMGGIITPQ